MTGTVSDPMKQDIGTGGGRNGDRRGVPTDPTELTDRAIAKAIAAIRDYVDGKIDVVEQRLDGIDEATKLRLDHAEQMPTRIDEKVGALDRLMVERFDAAERQRLEQKKDTKDAVDAALSAAKEAVKEQTTASERSIAKSEAATASQLKQQQETFTTAIEGLRRSQDEMKDRSGEDSRNMRELIAQASQATNNVVQQKAGAKEDRSSLYAGIGIIGTLLGIGLAIVGVLASRPA